jgi:hypothetical protein
MRGLLARVKECARKRATARPLLPLREARWRFRGCPVDIRAIERVRKVFAHPGRNR